MLAWLVIAGISKADTADTAVCLPSSCAVACCEQRTYIGRLIHGKVEDLLEGIVSLQHSCLHHGDVRLLHDLQICKRKPMTTAKEQQLASVKHWLVRSRQHEVQ
jgi:hypothetical protein